MNYLTKQSWSPYVAGTLAGLLLCLSVLIAGKYFGASTTFVRSVGLIEKAFIPEHVASAAYFVKEKVKIDWQMMFVIGVIFGALLSSKLSGDFKVVFLPPMWQQRFGTDKKRRYLIAFLGGGIAMFGARMAGG